jgi:type II secretory pathway pseudopilin PulG
MRITLVSEKRASEKRAGYTILEMAIVFIVAGLFVASFAQFYNVYIKSQRAEQTATAQRLVKVAIRNFLVQNGRYPCPSRLDAAREDADYGMEGVCDASDAAYPALAAGECANGICIEESANADPAIDSAVRRGAIPFRSLGLAERYSVDGFGMRLQYVVTEELAVNETYDKNGGSIDVVDGAGASLLQPVGSSHFVVFSTGEDKIGAYSRFGKPSAPCAAGILSSENCNTSAANKKAVYRAAPKSGAGANTFDDNVLYLSSAEAPLWKIVDSDGLHLNDMLDGANDKVSIGGSSVVAPDVKVAVAGNVKAENIMTGELTGASGEDAFASESISGEDDEFQCPPGHYASKVGLKDNAKPGLTCTPDKITSCKPREIMQGIDASGNIICSAYAGCASETFKGCWNFENKGFDAFTISPAIQGARYSGYTYTQNGAYYKPVYQCGDDGHWKFLAGETVGNCNTCKAVDEQLIRTCDEARDGRDGYWTGSVAYRRTVTCPGSIEKMVEVDKTWAETCVCRPTTEERFTPCGDGFEEGAQKRETRQWTCISGNKGEWTNWVQATACKAPACVEGVESNTKNCPEGYTGTWQRTRNRTCNPNVATSWLPKTFPPGACKCVGLTKTRNTKACPPGQTGEIIESQHLDCDTGKFSPWVIESNSCGLKVLKWAPGGAANESSQRAGPRAGTLCMSQGSTSPCFSPAGVNQYINYTACTCQ